MQYTQIPNVQIAVSKIGFGTWGLSGDSYGSISESQAINALEFAFDSGINFFDTADIYGNGKVESMLGNVFKKNRSKVILSSKVGYIKYPQKEQDFSPLFIRNRIENSLRRLKSDYIDVYFLHSPTTEVLRDRKNFDTLLKLKDEKKIKTIGVSVRTADDGLIAAAIDGVDVVQVIFNILDQRPNENNLTTELKSKNKTMVARIPLCFGFISGKYTVESKFGELDHRERWSKEQIQCWISASNKFNSYFKSINEYSAIQNAIKFTLSSKCNSISIPGMKTIEQVRQNIQSTSIPEFDEITINKLFSIYKESSCIPT